MSQHRPQSRWRNDLCITRSHRVTCHPALLSDLSRALSRPLSAWSQTSTSYVTELSINNEWLPGYAVWHAKFVKKVHSILNCDPQLTHLRLRYDFLFMTIGFYVLGFQSTLTSSGTYTHIRDRPQGMGVNSPHVNAWSENKSNRKHHVRKFGKNSIFDLSRRLSDWLRTSTSYVTELSINVEWFPVYAAWHAKFVEKVHSVLNCDPPLTHFRLSYDSLSTTIGFHAQGFPSTLTSWGTYTHVRDRPRGIGVNSPHVNAWSESKSNRKTPCWKIR